MRSHDTQQNDNDVKNKKNLKSTMRQNQFLKKIFEKLNWLRSY